MATVIGRIVSGVLVGLLIGCIYSVIAVAIFMSRGGEVFVRNDISLTETIGVYLIGGMSAGALVGLLYPQTKHPVGAVFVGTLAAIPVMVGVGLALYGPPSAWNPDIRLGLVISALLLGGFGGAYFGRWRR